MKSRKRMGSKRAKSEIEKFSEKLLKKMEENNIKLRKEILTKMEENNAQLRAEMEAGFKSINKRLDYIVKANKLKDIPQK